MPRSAQMVRTDLRCLIWFTRGGGRPPRSAAGASRAGDKAVQAARRRSSQIAAPSAAAVRATKMPASMNWKGQNRSAGWYRYPDELAGWPKIQSPMWPVACGTKPMPLPHSFPVQLCGPVTGARKWGRSRQRWKRRWRRTSVSEPRSNNSRTRRGHSAPAPVAASDDYRRRYSFARCLQNRRGYNARGQNRQGGPFPLAVPRA